LKIVHSQCQYFVLFISHITIFFYFQPKKLSYSWFHRCRLRHHLSCCITIFTFSLLPFACKFFPLLFFILFYIFYIHKHFFFRWNQGLSTQHSIKAFKRHCETCIHNFTYKMNKREAEKIEEAKWNENLSGIFIQLFAMLSYN